MTDNSESAAQAGRNLSEILFKPKFDYPETSQISNSGCPLPELKDPANLAFSGSWYRPVYRFLWAWQGANVMDVDEALAAIASSKGARTRPQCLDTVKEYGSGNWIYEFSSKAQSRAVKGREREDQGELKEAEHQYRMAARYFDIAAYPRLRGDVLAADAALLGQRCYRGMCRCAKDLGVLEELEFESGGRPGQALLHLPDRESVHPCVVLMCSYELSAISFWSLYAKALQPAGIAMAVVEMPGIGMSGKIAAEAGRSPVLEAAVEKLRAHPCIDSHSLGLMGVRLGGAAAIRYALLHPEGIKALALIDPAVHTFFADKELLNSLSLCQRSLYANRLNLDAAHWDLVIPQLRPLSLREQGLLGRGRQSPVPCLTACFKRSFASDEDCRLLKGAFSECKIERFDDSSFSKDLAGAAMRAAEFFRERLL